MVGQFQDSRLEMDRTQSSVQVDGQYNRAPEHSMAVNGRVESQRYAKQLNLSAVSRGAKALER